jgi:hypothetical protein
VDELNEQQLNRQDFVDNAISELLLKLNPSHQKIEWDIEVIGEVRDIIRAYLVKHLEITDEMTFYPYIETDSEHD